MQLAYRFYPPRAAVQAAVPKKDYLLVTMHGLLGSNMNMGGVASYLSGRMADYPAPPRTDMPVYPTLAFDWRNHGDSFHGPEHTLDVHSADLRDLLRAVACDTNEEMTMIRGGLPPPMEFEKHDSQCRKPKVVLVGHSMGGVILMDYLWKYHRASSTQPDFRDNVVGAVVVDVGPCDRPSWFFELEKDLKILKTLPLSQLGTMQECENWVKQNTSTSMGSNIWMIRYLLTNLEEKPEALEGNVESTNAHSNVSAIVPVGKSSRKQYQWKCNIDVLVDNMANTLWQQDVPPESDRVQLPTLHVFGANSPYKSEDALSSVPKFFANSTIKEVSNAKHFVHIEQRRPFTDSIREFIERLDE